MVFQLLNVMSGIFHVLRKIQFCAHTHTHTHVCMRQKFLPAQNRGSGPFWVRTSAVGPMEAEPGKPGPLEEAPQGAAAMVLPDNPISLGKAWSRGWAEGRGRVRDPLGTRLLAQRGLSGPACGLRIPNRAPAPGESHRFTIGEGQ